LADPTKPQSAARRNASNYFAKAEQREKLVWQEIEKQRATTAAKTAKLRALRLAKEAADGEAGQDVSPGNSDIRTAAGSLPGKPARRS
jgi:hypothetical protein